MMKTTEYKFAFRNRCLVLGACLVVALASPLRAQESLHYLSEGDPDPIALLAPPPEPGSAEQAADLAEVRAVEQSCPSNEIAAALREDRGVSMFYFTPVVGDVFAPGKLPKTEAFLERVRQDAQAVMNDAKDYWGRPRPYAMDPTLAPGVAAYSFSYPSGHSTESMALALVLADLFPDKREAIIAEARTIGWHRVEIARHYATDVYAGRVLAQAIVREMKKNAAFQHDLGEAKAEIAAAQTASHN